MSVRSVAVIGSFRKYNSAIQKVCTALRSEGVEVTSPRGSTLVTPGVEFVRFHSDNRKSSDQEIQTLALHRILRADFVYVVAPRGYIGRTTCYEIGRIVQARRPIYFSRKPKDLPIEVPDACVLTAPVLLEAMRSKSWRPAWLYAEGSSRLFKLERSLIEGRLVDE